MSLSDRKMTFWEHIDELRRCLIFSFISILFFSIVASFFSDNIREFLLEPIKPYVENNIQLVWIDVLSPFFLYISISFFTGLFLSVPIIVYNVLNFISPAIEKKKIAVFVFFLVLSTMLFFIGMAFTYKALIPTSFGFLIGFAGNEEMIISFNQIVNQILLISFCIGMVFQMPIISFFLARLNLISSEFLSSNRRYAILGAFILSAIITPPDIVSQIILGLPIILLYEICIIIARLVGRNDR
tara:strand:+ start:391 stop:1116 length:726 start_codon:yes stop_codon:yes gene_type:complete